MIVSIHQPNYLPWLGFFDKIKQSDTFVIFDNVQFPRGKKHFGHRNLIRTNNGSKWLTIPVIGKSEMRNFNEIKINYNGWNQEHLMLIENFYKKAPHFETYYNSFADKLNQEYESLSDLTSSLIEYFIEALDIKTKIVYCSKICPDEITGSERIMYLLKELQATKYISGTGPGSLRYIDEQEFKKNNIELVWQEYTHPNYNQLFKPFMPYMNILDLLFNEGPQSKDII